MFYRIIAILLGIVLIFVGVAGFLPTFITNNLLFGYFEVNTLHNVIHMITGVLAIMASTAFRATKLFFQLFGLFYVILAIWGFWTNGDLIIMHANLSDNILHLVIGVISVYLGFLMARLPG